MNRLFLFLLLFPLLAFGQNNRLYTTQHGLKTTNIHSFTIDKRGILWIGSSANLAFFDGTGFHYMPNFNPTNGLTYYSIVNRVCEDKDDCYWVLTNAGLYYFDSKRLSYKRIRFNENENEAYGYTPTQMLDYPGHPDKKIVITSGYGIFVIDVEKKEVNTRLTTSLQDKVKAHFLISAEIDHHNRLWLSTIHHEVICYDLQNDRPVQLRTTEAAATKIQTALVNSILEVQPHNAVYLATDDGVLRFNEKTETIECIDQTNGRPCNTLLYTQNGQLLLGTDSYGVLELEPNGSVSEFELVHPVYDLSTGKVRDMLQDPDGNLIIALYQKGILIIPHEDTAFRYHCISRKGDWRNSSCITSIHADRQGNYWVGTDGAGIFRADGNDLGTARPIDDGLRSHLVQSIETDHEGNIWIATYGGGVQKYDASNHRFVTPDWLLSFKDARVLSLAIDRTNALLYIGTSGDGVYTANLRTQTVEKTPCAETQGEWVTNIYVDPDHTLWVAELGGVGYRNPITGKQGLLAPEMLTYDTQCICSYGQSSEKRILLGSGNGLGIYDPSRGTMQHILAGIPVLSINPTENTIWIGSTNCIYAVDKKSLAVTTYSSLGGYYIGEFHRAATYSDESGHIYFGSDNGIISFFPDAMRSDRKIRNEILFTSIKAGGEELHYSDSTDYMDADIMYAQHIRLSHKQNTFSISFNVPSYSLAHQIHYEYKLEGYEDKWNNCTDVASQKATYSYLSPGTYKLHVRATLEGAPESTIQKTLTIHIAHPWYNSIYANLFYLILIGLVGYAIYHFWQVRRRQRIALREALHNEEIKEAKLRMFTSITHELRTPLTMIVSPLRQLMTKPQDAQTMNDLNTMRHNCNRLLDIVKQITDIRKIDAGQFELHFEQIDLCSYTSNIAQSFSGAASDKHIQFTLENQSEPIDVWIDPIHFEKVIVNILSNSFKFTPDGGSITLRNEIVDDNIHLTIHNTGPHISELDIDHIFERFYQSAEGQKHIGSGIGLNLAYELVTLHHATIHATNEQPAGVAFHIVIPCGNAHLSASELEPRPIEESIHVMQTEMKNAREAVTTHIEAIHTEATTNEGKQDEDKRRSLPNILIVDDSKDLCEYLSEQLSNDYNITLAFSGNNAWNIILQSRPDLIITDMKMPDGNGLELIQHVRENGELDSTPIIMLTGEGDDNLQLEAFNLRVDHFIQKPFNLTILEGAIRQTLGLRENIRRHVERKEILTNVENVELASAEDNLFERINMCVLEHLDDEEFGVQELANEVGISRVHLNRKMKEKYGLSPNVYIKTYRLKQAAYLLIHKKVNVSEVAYRVGFSTHSYFSSSFRDFFGMPPKDFVAYYTDPANADKLEKLLG